MVLVVYPQHVLAKRRTVPVTAITGEAFVGFQSGLQIRDEIDAALAAANVEVEVTVEFDNIETIKRAIEIGSGISILPEPTIGRELESGSLVKIYLEGISLERPLGIIHRRDRKLNETAKQFINLLQSQAVPAVGVPSISSAAMNGHSYQEHEHSAAVR